MFSSIFWWNVSALISPAKWKLKRKVNLISCAYTYQQNWALSCFIVVGVCCLYFQPIFPTGSGSGIMLRVGFFTCSYPIYTIINLYHWNQLFGERYLEILSNKFSRHSGIFFNTSSLLPWTRRKRNWLFIFLRKDFLKGNSMEWKTILQLELAISIGTSI